MTSEEFIEFLKQYEGYMIRGSYTYNPKWASGHQCSVCPSDNCLENECTDARGHQQVTCTRNPDNQCVINIPGYVCAFEIEDVENNPYVEGYLDENAEFFIFSAGDFQEFGVDEGEYCSVRKVIFTNKTDEWRNQ